MSLKDHKANNISISKSIIERIKTLGQGISDGLRNCGKLSYGIMAKDGSIWTGLKRRNLSGTYSNSNQECLIFYKEKLNDYILYHDLVNNIYYTEEEYEGVSSLGISLSGSTIESFVDEEDIYFKPVLPTVYASIIKAKIENSMTKSNVVLNKQPALGK